MFIRVKYFCKIDQSWLERQSDRLIINCCRYFGLILPEPEHATIDLGRRVYVLSNYLLTDLIGKIFSYSLLLSMDFVMKEELYPKFYYWIAHHAMKGAMCNIQGPTKDSTTLWDDVKCKPARIASLENMPTHNEGAVCITFQFSKGQR